MPVGFSDKFMTDFVTWQRLDMTKPSYNSIEQ